MSKITESAKGEECQVRIFDVCNRNPDTTIFAHLNGGGMGMKRPDSEGSYCCFKCHEVYDARTPLPNHWDRCDIEIAFYEGSVRTREILINKGLLILK